MGMEKKSKNQGHLIVVNGGRRNALEVETVWIGYIDDSCCGDKVRHGALPAQASGGEIKEGR